jgi:hypothetical protein
VVIQEKNRVVCDKRKIDMDFFSDHKSNSKGLGFCTQRTRFQVPHLCPEDRGLYRSDNTMLRTKVELFGMTWHHKRLFEVMKRLPVTHDLLGDPVLGGDGGHVGIVLSPDKYLIEVVELREKERVSLVLL